MMSITTGIIIVTNAGQLVFKLNHFYFNFDFKYFDSVRVMTNCQTMQIYYQSYVRTKNYPFMKLGRVLGNDHLSFKFIPRLHHSKAINKQISSTKRFSL